MDRASLGSQNSQNSRESSRRGLSVFGEDEGEGGGDGKDDAATMAAANWAATHPFRAGLFGVLYTLAKEKQHNSVKMALINALVEFVSIMTIMLQNKYPWNTNFNLFVWKLMWFIVLQNPISAWGLNLYLVIFYLFMFMLLFSLGICVWVAWCFKNDSFSYLWPIKFVRVVCGILFSTFYIMSLNVYLVMLQCSPHGGVWMQPQFKDIACFKFPFLLHLVISIIGSVLFAGIGLLLVMADHELNPLSRVVVGQPHSLCEIKMTVAKTVLTFADIVLLPWPKLQSVVILGCLVPMLIWHIDMMPYYTAWLNVMQGSFFALYVWIGVCLAWLMYSVKNQKYKLVGVGIVELWHVDNPETTKMVSLAMAYGILPAMLVGALASYFRLIYLYNIGLKFRGMPADTVNTKRIHRFDSDIEVELASRVCRVWDEDGKPLPAALDLGEAVLKAGQAQFPESVLLAISMSNFLIDVRGLVTSGWVQLDLARKMHPSRGWAELSFLFAIFTREQESKQKASVTHSGDNATDLVSYVEFQRNFRLLSAYHRAALLATRDFWRAVLRDRVDFVALIKVFRRMDLMEGLADKTYRTALDKYPKSIKLLRSYAAFVEDVKNDPWTAAKYDAEAEKQADEQEERATDVRMGTNDDSVVMASASDGIISINATGTMQMVNKTAARMLGYRKDEMEGKKVQLIMPAFFAQRHDGYLRRYVNTGKTHIVNTVRDVIALHKDKYVFPIQLLVNKVSGVGQDAVFMGVLKPVPVDPTKIRLWMLLDGTVMCLEDAFGDMAGWRAKDVVNRHVSAFVVESDALVVALAQVATQIDNPDAPEGAPATPPVGGSGGMGGCPVMNGSGARPLSAPMGVSASGNSMMGGCPVMNGSGAVTPSANSTTTGHHAMLRGGPPVASSSLPPGWAEGVVLATMQLHVRHQFANSVPCSVTFEASGSKDMRMLLATVRPAQDMEALLVLDSRTTVVFANRHAAALWGYEDRQAMHGLDLAALMAAPFGQLHQHFIKEMKESHGRKRAPASSCRAGLPHMLQLANGMHIAARLSISSIDQDANADDDSKSRSASTWLIKAERVSPEVAADERRLVLTVNPEGIVVAAGHSPKSLFGFDPAQAVGRPLRSLIDAFKLWHKAGSPAGPALAALAERSMSRPGITWRVAVLPHQAAVRSVSQAVLQSHSRPQAALMQVEPLESGDVALRLWRADLVTGVVEVNRHMSVVKADLAAGLVFGVPHAEMQGVKLASYLQLAASVHMEDLLAQLRHDEFGANKRGGMKRVAGAVGVRQVLPGNHDDGGLLNVTFQAVLRGTAQPHIIATVTSATEAHGSVELLQRAMAGDLTTRMSMQMPSLSHPMAPPMIMEPHKGSGAQRRKSITMAAPFAAARDPSPAPPSPANPLLAAAGGGSGSHSSIPQAMSDDSAMRSKEGGGVLNDSILARQRMQTLAEGGSQRAAGSLMRPSSDPQWGSVDHVDPDLVPIPEGADFDVEHHVAKDEGGGGAHPHPQHGDGMAVSEHSEGLGGGGGEESPRKETAVVAVKTEMRQQALAALDEDDKRAARRGIMIAQRWLESDYGEGGVPDSPAVSRLGHSVPTLVLENDAPLVPRPGKLVAAHLKRMADGPAKKGAHLEHGADGEGAHARRGHGDEEEEEDEEGHGSGDGEVHEDGEEALMAEMTAASAKAGGSEADEDSGTFRGRRLRRLMKLMSGQAATAALRHLRIHMWLLLFLLLAAHLGCFVTIMLRLSGEKDYVTNISGAADAMDCVHLASMYARCGESAYRNNGYTRSDLASLQPLLLAQLTRLATLHSALYLGFPGNKKGLRTASASLTSLWTNDALLSQLTYHDTVPPTLTTAAVGLFTMGNAFISNGKEVAQYMTQQKGVNASMSLLPAWLFLGNNGPGQLHTGYLQLLTDLTLAAETNVDHLLTLLLVLLIVEGGLLCVMSVAYVVYLSFRVAHARAALFMVFLAVPSGVARSMASKTVQLHNYDGSQEGDDDHQKKQEETVEAEEEDEEETAAAAALPPAPVGGTHGKFERHSLVFFGADTDQAAAPPPQLKLATLKARGSGKGSGKDSGKEKLLPPLTAFARSSVNSRRSMDSGRGSVVSGRSGKFGPGGALLGKHNDLFHGKKLVRTTTDVWKLCWPFVVWGLAVIVAYTVSYTRLSDVRGTLVAFKLVGRVQDQVARVMYFTAEVALAPTNATKLAAQAVLAHEADYLADVYNTTLYGGATLPDSVGFGAKDTAKGSLFFSATYPGLLFTDHVCQRTVASTCLTSASMYYQVATSGVDALVRRLILEATLLSLDPVAYVNSASSRWQFVWLVGRLDLLDGMGHLVAAYLSAADAAFSGQTTVVIVVEALAWLGSFLFFMFILRPFLRSTRSESRRVAKLLAQLPTELDVETMVKGTWKAITRQRMEEVESAASMKASRGKGTFMLKNWGSGAWGALTSMRMSFESAANATRNARVAPASRCVAIEGGMVERPMLVDRGTPPLARGGGSGSGHHIAGKDAVKGGKAGSMLQGMSDSATGSMASGKAAFGRPPNDSAAIMTAIPLAFLDGNDSGSASASGSGNGPLFAVPAAGPVAPVVPSTKVTPLFTRSPSGQGNSAPVHTILELQPLPRPSLMPNPSMNGRRMSLMASPSGRGDSRSQLLMPSVEGSVPAPNRRATLGEAFASPGRAATPPLGSPRASPPLLGPSSPSGSFTSAPDSPIQGNNSSTGERRALLAQPASPFTRATVRSVSNSSHTPLLAAHPVGSAGSGSSKNGVFSVAAAAAAASIDAAAAASPGSVKSP